MFNSMRIGLTGLRTTQSHLDVIGNNLTNSATFLSSLILPDTLMGVFS